ncbi:MAG: S24/S26 family peptidase [Cyanobacteria bacterium P01_F01_bin.116]
MLIKRKLIPNTGWGEYVQWLRRRRRRFVVRERSMVPTLMPGDTVLVEIGGAVQVGDIAVIRMTSLKKSLNSSSELLLIKRISEIFYDGSVYLISDNANELSARDSRHFGVIEANQVLGRVTSRLASSP